LFSTFAYEIGAVFLLAALLMYGTVSGLVPRALKAGKPGPIVLGVALLGFVIYRYGPDLYAGWLSIGSVAPSLTSSRPTPAEPTPAPRPVKSAASRANTQRQSNSSWKAIVLNDSVPAEPAPLVGKPIEDVDAKPALESSAPTEHADTTPAAASYSATGDTGRKAAEKSCCNSPYDSGAKRAIKSIGHFLHIGPRKEQAPQ